jgi:hypothetical protein
VISIGTPGPYGLCYTYGMTASQLASLLVGVAIGSVGSVLVTLIVDWLKERRERLRHWEDRRLDAYVDFARGAKEGMWYLFRVAAYLGNDRNPEPLSMEQAKPFLANAYEKRDAAFEYLTLVGSNELVERCREWTAEITKMRLMVNTEEHAPDVWAELVNNARAARDRYHESARRDLKVPRLSPR